MEFVIFKASDLITIRSNAFLSEGDVFKKPMLVTFPTVINDTLGKAVAIIDASFEAKLNEIIKDINDLDDDDMDELKKLMKKLPKRIWATALLRDNVLTTTDGDTITTKSKGSFAETLQTKVGDVDDVTFEDLQKALKETMPARKKITIHQHKEPNDKGELKNFYAISKSGSKYPIWDYCIE